MLDRQTVGQCAFDLFVAQDAIQLCFDGLKMFYCFILKVDMSKFFVGSSGMIMYTKAVAIITSAKEVMFLSDFVCLSVCV